MWSEQKIEFTLFNIFIAAIKIKQKFTMKNENVMNGVYGGVEGGGGCVVRVLV